MSRIFFPLFSFKRNDILTCKEPSAVHVLGFLCAAHKNRKSQSFGRASFYCWLFDMFFYYNSQQGAFISVMKTSWAIVRGESCTSPGGSQVSLQCCRKAFCSGSQRVLVLGDSVLFEGGAQPLSEKCQVCSLKKSKYRILRFIFLPPLSCQNSKKYSVVLLIFFFFFLQTQC